MANDSTTKGVLLAFGSFLIASGTTIIGASINPLELVGMGVGLVVGLIGIGLMFLREKVKRETLVK